MPLYRITAPNGLTYQIEGPPGASDADVAQAVAAQFPESVTPHKTAPASLRDTALSLFEGVTGAAQGAASAFGAENAVAKELGNIQQQWGSLKTPERQAEIRRRAQMEEAAARSGSKAEEAATFLGGVKEAPLQTFMQAAGSSVPAALAGIAATVAGAPAAIAGAVAIGARLLAGAVQGAGEVKGSIYENVERELLDQGMPREEARRKAIAAQEYLGKNAGNILAGAGLGAVAGGTGAETALARPFVRGAAMEAVKQLPGGTMKITKGGEGAVGKFARRTGLSEALPEGAQGGQERYASNVALQREGVETPEFQGVLGSALRDAASGALAGAGINAVTGRRAPEAPQQPPAPQVPPGAAPQTQGELFEGAGQKPPAEEAPPEGPTAPGAGQPTEQLDLGLEATRPYAELVLERERLLKEPQTPEIQARIAQLTKDIEDRNIYEVDRERGKAAVEEEGARRFPALANAPLQEPSPQGDLFGGTEDLLVPEREQEVEAETAAETAPPAGQYRLPLRTATEKTSRETPEPTITSEDVMMTGIALPKSTQVWAEKNVWGRTRTQLKEMIARQPELAQGRSPQAQLLRELTAPEAASYEEPKNVTPSTPKVAPKPNAEPRAGEPSVGVPGKPAGAKPARPGARVAPAAGGTTEPVGRGLVPAGQPAGKGTETAGQQPAAVTPKDLKAAYEAAEKELEQATRRTEQARRRESAAGYEATGELASRVIAAEQERQAAAEKARRTFDAWQESMERPAPKEPTKVVPRRASVFEQPTTEAAPVEETPTAETAPAAKEKPASVFDWQSEKSTTGAELQKAREEDEKVRKGRKSVTTREGQSLAQLQENIANGKGLLYAALRRMIRSGKVVLEFAHPSGEKIGGYFDGKKVTLYADGIPAGDEIAVALHEVAAHLGLRKMLGDQQYKALSDRILQAARSKESSPERSLAQRALNRIPEEDIARGEEVYRDEAIAYYIEELAKAEASGEMPKAGALRNLWSQIKAALVSAVNRALNTNFKVSDFTPQEISALSGATFQLESFTGVDEAAETKRQFSVAPSTKALVESMGDLDPTTQHGLFQTITGFKASNVAGEPSYATKFRTQVADIAATIEERLSKHFDGAVRNSLGALNPMGLYRQAQDYTKLLLEFFQVGGLSKDPATGLWVVTPKAGIRAPSQVYDVVHAWGAKQGLDKTESEKYASRILEGHRLDQMRTANKQHGTGFLLHLNDAQIDTLEQEYQSHPELQDISKLMDEARIGMVDNMVAAGRLSKEQGQEWKDVVGYVPFDRIEDFSTKYSHAKRISTRGLAQLGRLPQLIGSETRPVGNVFDNHINTLGWMVGQTMKTDANTQTLRSLEKYGYAKFLGRNTRGLPNTVRSYVDGEEMYWQVMSKYDVMAFNDLNPPKATWLRALGSFSRVLRTAVTALPPFALKQVTDDVQRAILTSGVRNPGALLRMSLANFGSLAWAELRGIQHPSVRDFGRLGLTGEYDFEAGKPAASLLKDLGHRPRGKFGTLMHRLEGITRASDLAVRQAIYEQTLKETNDQLLAQTRAREFINFRRRGASDFVGAMVTTIPFFNAYIQGMDVLYRAASGKDSSSSVGRAEARRMFWSRAGTVMVLASLYALGKGDDEEYAEMDLRTRNNNWILGGGYKIPVPGELGALFKVIPETVVEYMRRQGTPEEQTAWEATHTALSYIFEQYVGRVTPVPQAVKPLLEAFTNHSFFTGRELIGIHQKQMEPSMQRAANTSELAIAIAEFARDTVGVDAVSPILVDNALSGYFGSSAALLTAVTDSLLNPTRTDRPLHKWALVSNYMYDPVGTRRMSEFYETREAVGRANTTLNELAKTDLDRAAKYAEEHADELALESAVNSTLEQLERTRAYRKYLNSPLGAEEMSSAEREKEMQEVRKMEVEMTSWLREAKASLRQ
jgi:hypothetical protein